MTARGYTPNRRRSRRSFKTERYAVKPMFVDEAVLADGDVRPASSWSFKTPRTRKVNVLYRRKNGDFGLIEPILTVISPREIRSSNPRRFSDGAPRRQDPDASRSASFFVITPRICSCAWSEKNGASTGKSSSPPSTGRAWRLSGFFQYFANKRVQVIGSAEMSYLKSLPGDGDGESVSGSFVQPSHSLRGLSPGTRPSRPSCPPRRKSAGHRRLSHPAGDDEIRQRRDHCAGVRFLSRR